VSYGDVYDDRLVVLHLQYHLDLDRILDVVVVVGVGYLLPYYPYYRCLRLLYAFYAFFYGGVRLVVLDLRQTLKLFSFFEKHFVVVHTVLLVVLLVQILP
jgi:hypothetical protein